MDKCAYHEKAIEENKLELKTLKERFEDHVGNDTKYYLNRLTKTEDLAVDNKNTLINHADTLTGINKSLNENRHMFIELKSLYKNSTDKLDLIHKYQKERMDGMCDDIKEMKNDYKASGSDINKLQGKLIESTTASKVKWGVLIAATFIITSALTGFIFNLIQRYL